MYFGSVIEKEKIDEIVTILAKMRHSVRGEVSPLASISKNRDLMKAFFIIAGCNATLDYSNQDNTGLNKIEIKTLFLTSIYPPMNFDIYRTKFVSKSLWERECINHLDCFFEEIDSIYKKTNGYLGMYALPSLDIDPVAFSIWGILSFINDGKFKILIAILKNIINALRTKIESLKAAENRYSNQFYSFLRLAINELDKQINIRDLLHHNDIRDIQTILYGSLILEERIDLTLLSSSYFTLSYYEQALSPLKALGEQGEAAAAEEKLLTSLKNLRLPSNEDQEMCIMLNCCSYACEIISSQITIAENPAKLQSLIKKIIATSYELLENKYNEVPLAVVFEYDYPHLIAGFLEISIDKRVDINKVVIPRVNNDIPLLHFAAKNGKIAALMSLIKNGADINLKSADGNSALYYAVFKSIPGFLYTGFHLDAVKILLIFGADFAYFKEEQSKEQCHLKKDLLRINIIEFINYVENFNNKELSGEYSISTACIFFLIKTNQFEWLSSIILAIPNLQLKTILDIKNHTLERLAVDNELHRNPDFKSFMVKLLIALYNPTSTPPQVDEAIEILIPQPKYEMFPKGAANSSLQPELRRGKSESPAYQQHNVRFK